MNEEEAAAFVADWGGGGEDDALPHDVYEALEWSGDIDAEGHPVKQAESMLFPAVLALHHAHREREQRSDSVSRYLGSVAWAASMDAVVDMNRPGTDKTELTRKVEVGKSRFDDCPAGSVTWLDWWEDEAYGYKAGDAPKTDAVKLKSGKTVGLPDRVRTYMAAHPTASKAAVARGLSIRKGGSSSYRILSETFDSVRTDSHADVSG